ncbi:MAG: 16S rRNA (cytosine(1402)-N(4))-methyltransferase RsmH, partial [Muribaculaceae bacterium]|nr:16S rRNA (cytosine(1402)-N(4))-methyltransferase RsmH [Muribaculaceae bacterium]
ALLPQALKMLDIKPEVTYVDCTFGGGGHSRAIVESLSAAGHLYGFDQDMDAVSRAFVDPRFTIVRGNFRFMLNFLRFYGVGKVDGILADLGVSFHHFDDPQRGFSFRFDGPLDMRMNRDGGFSAADLVARYTEEQIADILYLYGEMKNSRRIASAIVKARTASAITTTEQLIAAVDKLLNPRDRKTDLAKIFQALRIEVNGELDALRHLLGASLKTLKPGGRLAIITYHSLEDRLVKNFMRTGNFEGKEAKDFYGRNLSPFKLLTSKPIVPDAAEIAANPRSRSAKMRVAELVECKV